MALMWYSLASLQLVKLIFAQKIIREQMVTVGNKVVVLLYLGSDKKHMWFDRWLTSCTLWCNSITQHCNFDCRFFVFEEKNQSDIWPQSEDKPDETVLKPMVCYVNAATNLTLKD